MNGQVNPAISLLPDSPRGSRYSCSLFPDKENVRAIRDRPYGVYPRGSRYSCSLFPAPCSLLLRAAATIPNP